MVKRVAVLGILLIIFSGVWYHAIAQNLMIYMHEAANGTIFLTDMPDAGVAYRPFALFKGHGKADRRAIEHWAGVYSRKYGVSPDLIRAMIFVESGYDPDAVSPKGAQGVMQIMPETGKELGLDKPFEARGNIEAGVRYFSGLLKKYKTPELALAAYNAGPGRVDKYGGVPPFEETRAYIRKVMQIVAK